MKHFAFNLSLAVGLCVALSGCSGGSSGLPQGRIHTNLYNNGVYSNWPNAFVYADAVSFGCNIGSSGCNLSQSGQADGSGNYAVKSNAVPGTWEVAVQADGYCPTGAGTSTQHLDPNVTAQINCNNINQTTAYISPSSCEKDTYLDGTVTNSCPGTIAATTSGSGPFPTNHAMNVSTYTEKGTNLSSQSITANSSTTLVLPTPLRPGDNVVVIKDPNTNAVLAAGLFTYTVWQERCNTGPGGSNKC